PGVELRQQSRTGLHPTDRLRYMLAQRVEQLRFTFGDALLGAEHLRFVFLEVRRHVPLGAGESLPPLVIGRDALAVCVRDLDVVTEHLVEADLERSDTGAFPLARLQGGDVLLPAVAGLLQLVELAIET